MDDAPETLPKVEIRDASGIARANTNAITSKANPPKTTASTEHRTRHTVQKRRTVLSDKRPDGEGWCEKNDSVCRISDVSEARWRSCYRTIFAYFS